MPARARLIGRLLDEHAVGRVAGFCSAEPSRLDVRALQQGEPVRIGLVGGGGRRGERAVRGSGGSGAPTWRHFIVLLGSTRPPAQSDAPGHSGAHRSEGRHQLPAAEPDRNTPHVPHLAPPVPPMDTALARELEGMQADSKRGHSDQRGSRVQPSHIHHSQSTNPSVMRTVWWLGRVGR